MTKLRVGVIGAGTISQVEHIPNLVALSDLFEVVGVADPSSDRAALRHRRPAGVPTFETPDQLLGQELDAVVIGSPDPLHYEQVMAALARGLHVFCEKPLCYSPAEIADIIAARDKAGQVVQVGYMKRFDPSYRLRARESARHGRDAALRLGRGQRPGRLAVHRACAHQVAATTCRTT